ncbi:MAG: beta-glucosidase [Actinomycetales bacterium]|nr:beta-glucosidase [Actinomycetales bacterium]
MSETELDRVLRERLSRLDLERKVRLLTGVDFWALYAEPEAGLRPMVLSDGPAGVRGVVWDERDTSTNIPSATALAASWDVERVQRLGLLIAAEARTKGVHVLLAPTVNLHRTPYGGRHFECYSEDPLLSAAMGAAFVRGVQAGGVAATVKHFVANDSETQRMTVNAIVDERALRELYLAPFEVIVREAGVWAVMAAYNQVNGITMTESPLLREVLKDEWGFDGLVMSDWSAARTTDASASAALDLLMPGPRSPWNDALVEAVRAGRVPESAVDDKVLRLLRLAARVGALDGVPAGTIPAVPAPGTEAAEVRAAAAAGMVLVRNAGVPAGVEAGVEIDGGPGGSAAARSGAEGGPAAPLLPLDASRLRRLAVVGPNAAVARTLGGGSATVYPPYTVSPLAGLVAALGPDVRVDTCPGVSLETRIPPAPQELLRRPDGAGEGLDVEFFDAEGTLLARSYRKTGSFAWLGRFEGIPAALVSRIEVRGRIRAPEAGEYRIAVSGLGLVSLTLGGRTVVDTRVELPPGADVHEGFSVVPQPGTTVRLDAGEELDLVMIRDLEPESGKDEIQSAFFQLNIAPVTPSDDELLARAEELAREADAVVVVVGTTEEVESEGFDRRTLALPGRQDELVHRMAVANPRTVVVVNSGAPVLTPWRDEIGAVLLSWFGGQEYGNALADVLLGRTEPGGRLPTTWPVTEADPLPSPAPVDGVLEYTESIHLGHRAFERAGAEPAFPFGHGLGYTTWEYLGLDAPVRQSPGHDTVVTVRLRNSGTRRGREVVQVYASRAASGVDRPTRWLVGFALVAGAPGEQVSVAVPIRSRAFEHWDVATSGWVTEPGVFTLHAGRSSADLPLSVDLELTSTP